MAKNALFNFLFKNESTVQLPQGCKLVLDTNKESHYYFRIECPKQTKVLLKDKEHRYELDKHHISVYQNEYRDNPKLSQYHYTADFKNQLGEHFRLHVYFNAFDHLLSNITFEKETNNGYELVDSKGLRSQFILLALKHTKPLINKLRQQHNETISGLEARYNECEEHLAKHFDSQKENAVEALQITEKACAILRELIPLSRSPNYPKFLRFHDIAARALRERQSLQVSPTATPQLKALHNKSTDTHEDTPSNPEVASQDSASSKEEVPAVDVTFSMVEEAPTASVAIPTTKTNSSKKSKTTYELEHELEKLNSQFENLNKTAKEVQAKKIEKLLAKTYEISLVYEHQIKLAELQQLQKIRRGLNTLGANLLPVLLFNKQFELAALLTSFHHLLHAEKYISVALQTRNPNLLNFILEYGDVDVNHQPVTVHKIPYPSTVDACFYEDSHSNSMTECLSVLIKHGGSLFAPDNKNKGLPIAYSILSGNSHPLFKALLMNREKTIDSPDFFKNLIVLLRAYLEREDLSTSERSAIELELNSFETQLEVLQNPPFRDSSSRYVKKRANYLEEKYFGSQILQLKRDPMILAAYQEVQKASSQLASKLTKAQLRQENIVANNDLENLDKLLDGIDITNLDFDFIKTEVLKSLNDDLQLIEKKSQLIDVQKEITRHPIYSRRGSRKYREKLQEQDTLLQDIRKLENQDIESLEHSLKDLENITKTLGSLQGMSTLLTQFSSLFSSLVNDSPTLSTEGKVENIGSRLEEEEEEEEVLDSKKTILG
ncbi:hypothetical protein [Legionella resiliens]|uniref:Coiled-coil-containing protein n=1 Tax=Legionella resiliens TaxID=2905958 RepID=A0ABS8X0M6_9GAMM|nr:MULTISPECIES: hypothetical protein [unclassified Legionella]MCE0721701.1 hypothetical protein [Legionella sp. 9fVS26]MCE3530855.1 hypothetical protein [Legionella sp. 8cVS16]